MKWKPVLKKNYHQLIFVFIAFLLMILVSVISMSLITRQKLQNASEEALRTVEANIKINLQEPEATLVGATFTVRNMVFNQNASQDEILQYLAGLTDWVMENQERVSGFNGIYGIVRGDYLDGTGWEPPVDYIPQERPWYIAAKERNTEIAITAPYIDAQTQVAVISFAQEVRSSDGDSVGVISLDVMLTRLTEYVTSLQQSYGGYGILLDSDFAVIAHPDKELVGTPFEALSKEYSEVVTKLKAGSYIQDETIYDTDGTRMILFFRKLYNGWYVGMLIPSDSYYRDMYRMEAILIVMGIILMLALSFILMRLAVAKMRSDEENQSKSSFLARMSHEIRTPMNAIFGMAELMLRKDLPDDAREQAVAIKQAGSNLLSIIGDILDFSKIESNRIEIVTAKYYLGSLINDVTNIIRVRVDNSPVKLISNVDANLPFALEGDEARLRQVLLNLLSNAVKYTREGKITFTVTEEKRNGDTVFLSFAIADTGIGIKAEDLDKLFGEFTRFDTHKNIGVEGTGLGLAIARSLCFLMGGNITVSSKYGKGSVFTVTLPQRIADHTPIAKDEVPKLRNEAEDVAIRFIAPTARILIVDDVEVNLKVAEGLLSPYKTQIDCCTCGMEAIRLVLENDYDIVFVDHMMPEMDGIETVKNIRALGESRFRKLLVVALTANAVSGMREMFLGNGFDDYLAKPIEMTKLNEIMEKWIPIEKRTDSAASEKYTPDCGAPVFHIDGLDTKRGLMMTGGSVDNYREVLALFCRDAAGRIDFLNEAPCESDLKLFVTQVHALKSVSASIGASVLSEQAAFLENAGHSGDIDAVQTCLDAFRTELEALVRRIETALSVRAGEATVAVAKIDASVLRNLKKALEEENVGTIDSIMDWLEGQSYNVQTEAAISKISKHILISDFEEAIHIIDNLLREV